MSQVSPPRHLNNIFLFYRFILEIKQKLDTLLYRKFYSWLKSLGLFMRLWSKQRQRTTLKQLSKKLHPQKVFVNWPVCNYNINQLNHERNTKALLRANQTAGISILQTRTIGLKGGHSVRVSFWSSQILYGSKQKLL